MDYVELDDSPNFQRRRAALAKRHIPADVHVGTYTRKGRRDYKAWECFVHDAPDANCNVKFVKAPRGYEIWTTRAIRSGEDLLGNYPHEYWLANYFRPFESRKRRRT